MNLIGENLLYAATVAAQKLEKKFRQLRNRGEVTDQQLATAKRIVEQCRALCDQLGVEREDIDRHQRGRNLGRAETSR